MQIGKMTAVIMNVSVFLLANAVSIAAFALPEVRQGDLFSGVDSVSGEVCAVRITRDLSKSIWGSVIELEYTVGRVSQLVGVANHPFIGGNSFGKSLYQMNTRTDQNGVAYSLTDMFWVQLNLTEDGQEAELTYGHLGTSRGGLMIGEARGDEIRCILRRQ